MTYQELFNHWGLSRIKLNFKFASVEFEPQDTDRDAAWDMYVELLTRITTQPLAEETGDEKTALDSVYSLFPTTRSILKEKGKKAPNFSRIAIIILNQIVRPFSAKWHRKCLAGAFRNTEECIVFRSELEELRKWLTAYARLLADMAQVEDLTDICFEY